MANIILDIKARRDQFSRAEQRIADFLLENAHSIVPLSITELAEACGCSEATIVRFARHLGFRGYQQLKISIAREENLSKVNESISSEDSAFEVFNKVIADIYCSLQKTKDALNKESLQAVCARICTARRICIFGLGNSASVAHDAEHKLLRLGLNATAYTDNHMQAIAATHMTAADLAIGISHSGSSRDIVAALQLARANGAVTACITNRGKSPINKASDYILNTVSDETNYNILGMNSRIAQLAIIDTIYYYLASHLPAAQQEIEKTEAGLLDKKY